MSTVAVAVGDVKVVVSVHDNRYEAFVPVEVANDQNRLIANLREQEINLPAVPMVSKNEAGEVLVYEQPSFG